VHACIDVSDGLCKDLATLAKESRLTIAIIGAPRLDDDAIYGGEDYSRCFAVGLDSASFYKLTGEELYLIGRAVPDVGPPVLLRVHGEFLPLEDRSFCHFRHDSD
jgi:thiamine monophosphate kinase